MVFNLHFSRFGDSQVSSRKSGIRIPSYERAYAAPRRTEELRSCVHFGLHLKQPILNLRKCCAKYIDNMSERAHRKNDQLSLPPKRILLLISTTNMYSNISRATHSELLTCSTFINGGLNQAPNCISTTSLGCRKRAPLSQSMDFYTYGLNLCHALSCAIGLYITLEGVHSTSEPCFRALES